MPQQDYPATTSFTSNHTLVVRLNDTHVIPDVTQFTLLFPPELQGRVEPAVLRDTVEQINAMLRKASMVSVRTVVSNLLACLTLYITDMCRKTKTAKTMDRISKFVKTQNQKYFLPAGLQIVDPRKTGLLHLDIIVR
ncbi:Golgin sub A member 7B [Geranomyces michiganensis]|nr:Golgin sub A member 7B [Geranomyces michiganensis]